MGNGNDGKVGSVDKQPVTGTTAGGISGNSTGSADTGARTGAGAGARTGTAARTEEKKVPQLVPVTPEDEAAEKKRLEKNAKKRAAYAEKKAAGTLQAKPKKTKKAETAPTFSGMSVDQLNALLMSTSAVIASRPNCSHWMLTEAECKSITTPLVAMIAESEKLEFVTKNSNQIALAVACFTIFVPRIFVTVQLNKAAAPKKKEIKKNDTGSEVRKTESSDQKPGTQHDGITSGDSADDGELLSWDDGFSY